MYPVTMIPSSYDGFSVYFKYNLKKMISNFKENSFIIRDKHRKYENDMIKL